VIFRRAPQGRVTAEALTAFGARAPQFPVPQAWRTTDVIDRGPAVPDGGFVELWAQVEGVPYPVPHAALVVRGDATIEFAVVVTCPQGPAGAWYQEVFTDDGSAPSRHGPIAPFASADTWRDAVTAQIAFVLDRQRARAAGWENPDRQRPAEHAAFRAFMADGMYPRLQSWTVRGTLPADAVPPHLGRIEIWDATVSDPPFVYPHLLAGYTPSGRLRVIVAVELMPDMHDDVYLGMFLDGSHHNLDADPALTDLGTFVSRGVDIVLGALASPVAPPVTAPDPLPETGPETAGGRRSVTRDAPPLPDVGQPPPQPPPLPAGVAPTRTPDDAQTHLRELRLACIATWEPPDPAAVASFLYDLADTLEVLQPTLLVIAALRSAAARLDDAEALHRAGWELVDVGLDELAVAPLALALALAPGNASTVNELALALEAAGSPAEAARLYRENAWAQEVSESTRGLCSHFAAMVGDWQTTYDMASRIDPAGECAFFRERAVRRLGRANAVHGVARLTDDDVRGWDAVLAGSLLLCRASDELVGMNGRFGAQWERADDLVQRLGVLHTVLARAGRSPTRVVAGPDRDSQVLGWTLANLFGLPAPASPNESTPPGSPSLVVLFDWSLVEKAFFDRFAHDRDVVLFAYGLDWTRRHQPAPDLVAVQAQAVFPPWHQRLRLDGPPEAMADPDPARRPKVVSIPADDREPHEIAADLATLPDTPTGDADLDELLRLVDALRARPDEVGLFGGARDHYFPDGPVASPKLR
jgi:hypothetical protein